MNTKLEELKNKIKEKVTLKEGEWELNLKEVIAEVDKMLESFPTARPEDREKMIYNRVYTFYKRQLSSSAKTYEGIILGVSDITDFGAKNTYNRITEKWKIADDLIKKDMIDSSEVNANGEPLWNSDNSFAEWKHGKKIEPEKERQRQLVALMKSEDDAGYKIANINLRFDKLNIEIPKFQLIKARLNGKYNEDKELYYLNSAAVTEFIAIKEDVLTYIEYNQLVDEYFKESTYDLNAEADLSKLKSMTNKRLVFVKNGIPTRCTETSGRSNVVEISSGSMGFDDDDSISCWVSKDEELPVEGFGEVIVCGNPGERDGKLFLNTMSIFSSINIPKPQDFPETEEEQKDEVW